MIPTGLRPRSLRVPTSSRLGPSDGMVALRKKLVKRGNIMLALTLVIAFLPGVVLFLPNLLGY